jgi:hypothetical protein
MSTQVTVRPRRDMGYVSHPGRRYRCQSGYPRTSILRRSQAAAIARADAAQRQDQERHVKKLGEIAWVVLLGAVLIVLCVAIFR